MSGKYSTNRRLLHAAQTGVADEFRARQNGGVSRKLMVAKHDCQGIEGLEDIFMALNESQRCNFDRNAVPLEDRWAKCVE